MISCELESYQSCWLRDCQNNGTIPLWFVPKENYFLNGVLTTIMPGKINPVISESVIQVVAQVVGNDASVTLAGQGGYFELNTMMPVAAHNILPVSYTHLTLPTNREV